MTSQTKSLSVVVGSLLSGSVGSPTVDKQVAQIVRPLRVVVEEVRALKEMGKDPISKDENAVRRLLNALHRVFTIGVIGNNYGSFWDFLIAAEEQISRQQQLGSKFDRFTRVVPHGRARVLTPSAAAAPEAHPTADDSTSSAKQAGGPSGTIDFPSPSPAQERVLVKSIEHVRSFNITNKLNCLHYWIITALQQGGILTAALTCAVVPMRDVLQAYMGPESPFYAQQSAEAMANASEGDGGITATLCFPFLNELRRVFEDLEHHPEMGEIKYNLDITSMQLFQTVTDRNGNLIIGVNGADNTEQVEFFVPNALHTAYSSRGRGGRRKRGGAKKTTTVGTNTDVDLLTSVPKSPKLLPISSSPLRSAASDAYTLANNPQIMSDQTAILAFNGDVKDSGNKSSSGAKADKQKFSVMTFSELCEMQNALLDERRELRIKEESLSVREQEVAAKEQEVADASAEIFDVLLKLKDLYIRHVVGLRERQEMGLKISAKDIDRKIPQLLGVLDHGDFDMVADEDELNAAGMVRASQRRFVADAPDVATNSSSTASPGTSVTSRMRASSAAFLNPGLGTKPLVIDDPEDGVPPHKVAGLIPLKVTEPSEKERNDQLRAQNFLCADCGASFGGEGSNNLLLKKLQKTSEILTMQKPRRCHYCTQLLCHNCHTNQTALLPFRVIPKWDFSSKHVCKRCHTFLQQNYPLAHYDLRKMPREIISANAVFQQCANIRKYLMRAALIISGCTRPTSASFAQDLHTHYFQREFFYSMSDLNTVHLTEKRESNPANIVPGVSNVVGAMQWVAGVNVVSLVDRLSAKLAQCKQHIRIDCANCKTRSSMCCTICNVTHPVFIVDEDSTQCRKCHSIYHVKCLAAKGCPECGK